MSLPRLGGCSILRLVWCPEMERCPSRPPASPRCVVQGVSWPGRWWHLPSFIIKRDGDICEGVAHDVSTEVPRTSEEFAEEQYFVCVCVGV